jgi:hypothetical protein
MRVISGTGRGALALFLASHEYGFKVPYDCCTMAKHRELGLTVERATHVRKCPPCNETSPQSRALGSSSTVSGTSMSGERSTAATLMDHIPRCPYSWYVIQLHDRVVHALEEVMMEAGATGTCGWRSAVFCRELLEIDLRMRCDYTSWPHTVILLLM